MSNASVVFILFQFMLIRSIRGAKMNGRIGAVFFDLFETLITESGFTLEHRAVAANGLGIEKDDFSREWKSRQIKLLRGEFPDYPQVLPGDLPNDPESRG